MRLIVILFLSVLGLFKIAGAAEVPAECVEIYQDEGAFPGDPSCKFNATVADFDLSTYHCGNPGVIDAYCNGEPPEEEEPDREKNNECGPATGPNQAGNPINMFLGNKIERATDFEDPFGLLTFSRHYSSSTLEHNPGTVLGTHWRHAFQISLTESEEDGEIVQRLNRPSGNSYVFREDGNGWQPDADVRYRLERLTANGSPSEWRVHTPDNRIERFDPSGRLLSITNLNGDTVTFTYDGSERLARVENRRGRALVFAYQNGLLASVTRPDGEALEYTYDSGRLVEVHYPTAGATETLQYLYENTNEDTLLTGIVDEKGQRYASWEYDNEGRATASWHGGSGSDIDKVSLSYGDGETQVTQPLGKVVTYGYEVDYGRAKMTSADHACSSCGGGEVQSRTYDANGYPDQHTDFNGRTTDYDYNAAGQQIRRTEASGSSAERTVEQDWHPDLHVPMARRTYDASGALIHRISWTRNGRGQPLTRTERDPATSASRATTFQYCEQADVTAGSCPLVGLLTEVDGPRQAVNDVTTYAYYAADHGSCGTGECPYRKGDLHTLTNGLGQETKFLAYDSVGHPTRIEDANGVITELQYDARDRLVRYTQASGLPEEAVMQVDYDATGEVAKITSPNGAWMTFEYDAAHRLTALEDALGNRIEYTLDAAGNRIEERVLGSSGSLLRERAREYDQLSRLVAEINGVGDRTEHDYDPVGNRTETEDAASQVTGFGYDALDRLIKVTDALNGETTYEYDDLDNLTRVVDPRGVTTAYENNAFGDVVKEESPDAGTTVYTYDAAGNRATKSDARGITATFSYDVMNRLTGVDYPGTGDDIQYQYDQGLYGKGRLTGFSDASGSTALTYGPRGNVLSRTESRGSISFLLQYDYNAADHVVSITYPSGMRIDLERDSMGRVIKVEATLNGAVATLASGIRYQSFGAITDLTYGNGLLLSRLYDGAGRYQAQSVNPVQGLSWSYDAVGNITDIQDLASPQPRSQTFAYDALGRLTMAMGAYGTKQYEYDAVGNRTLLIEGGVTTDYEYAGDSNRLLDVGGQSISYDANGNTLSLDGDTFTYGARNRRRTTESDGSLVARYEYNALGLRAHKDNEGTETHFVYGHDGRLIGEYDASGQVIREYVYLEGQPLALIRAAEPYYFHNDHLGSPLKLTDQDQNIVWDGIRSPFGEVDIQVNTIANPLRFPGQYFDQETGLHQNWFRDYSQSLGRYIQIDPLGHYGDPNAYLYALGSPVNVNDPFGLFSINIDLYGGLGGGLTFGFSNKTGQPFWGGRLGLGVGGGVGWDLSNNGPTDRDLRPGPYSPPCGDIEPASSGTSYGTFGSITAGIGPVEISYGGDAGYHADGTGASYRNGPGFGVNTNAFGGDSVSLGGAIGLEVMGWTDIF